MVERVEREKKDREGREGKGRVNQGHKRGWAYVQEGSGGQVQERRGRRREKPP